MGATGTEMSAVCCLVHMRVIMGACGCRTCVVLRQILVLVLLLLLAEPGTAGLLLLLGLLHGYAGHPPTTHKRTEKQKPFSICVLLGTCEMLVTCQVLVQFKVHIRPSTVQRTRSLPTLYILSRTLWALTLCGHMVAKHPGMQFLPTSGQGGAFEPD